MTSLFAKLTDRIKAAFNAEPIPSWFEYLHQTAGAK